MQHFVLEVRFFRQAPGNEPVRDWLARLDGSDKKAIGADIKTVQIGWPLGMPLVRKIREDLWEIRVHLHRRIARILFTVIEGEMILLHGFIKKTQALPRSDLSLAAARLSDVHQATKLH
jgi:phage-related protein